jgi:hypothetical protein
VELEPDGGGEDAAAAEEPQVAADRNMAATFRGFAEVSEPRRRGRTSAIKRMIGPITSVASV